MFLSLTSVISVHWGIVRSVLMETEVKKRFYSYYLSQYKGFIWQYIVLVTVSRQKNYL